MHAPFAKSPWTVRRVAHVLLALGLSVLAGAAIAQATDANEAAVLAPPRAEIALRLQDFFQTPVGTKGLVLSDTLQRAQGQRVRLTGFVVQQEVATLGRFLLTPRPVQMSQHADGEADDLPPATVLVRLDASQQDWAVAHARGLVEVTGTLDVGRLEESDGRVTWFRLQLDPQAVRAMNRFEVANYLHSLQHSH